MGILDLVSLRVALLGVVLASLALASLALSVPVAADTQYNSRGWGSTYRNNPGSCFYLGVWEACHHGIWGATGAYSGQESHVMAVALYPEQKQVHCTQNPQNCEFIWVSLDFVDDSDAGYTDADYYDTAYVKRDHRGYSGHRNLTLDAQLGNIQIWWTSDGY